MRHVLFAAAVFVVAAAACGAEGPDATSDGTEPVDEPDAESPVEGEWLVDELTVDGTRVDLDPDWPITLDVVDDGISGTAACNHYSGTVDTSAEAGHGTFLVSDLSWTEMGCEPPGMDLEQSFLTALQAVDSYEAADGLYVAQAGVGTNFHLTRRAPVEDVAFSGTTWVLDTYLEGEAAANWPDMADVTFRFDEDGTLSATTACRTYQADWAVAGEEVTLSDLEREEIAGPSGCDDGDSELDALVLGVLEGPGATATVDGRRMTLLSERDGIQIGLSFQPDGPDDADQGGSSESNVDLAPGGGIDGPVMYAARREEGGAMDAQILGTLELDGNCLYTAFEGNRYPVLWPNGTAWDADSSSVVLPDGTTIALGGELDGGGGYLYADTIGGFTGNEEVHALAAECAEEPYFEVAVLQQP